MDLVTLIAACALSVEPKSPPSGLDPRVMQALIFEQSGGEPWSFSVHGEGFARVLPTMRDALREARAVRPEHQKIHIGLAGLPTEPESATELMFAPCPNVALATLEISQFVERCRTTTKPDPAYCAIAVYHGSWDQPDTWFANDVRARVAKGNAPNLELPNDADAFAAGAMPTDGDRARAWSSALFPADSMTADRQQTDTQNHGHDAAQSQSIGTSTDMTLTNKTPSHGLFVPGSSEPTR
jgi:hypothetical protein